MKEQIGMKDDSEKPRFSLIPQEALLEVAKVMTFGAKKYAPENWRYVDNGKERYIDAAQRHINQYLRGEALDKESGLLHLAHAIASLMMNIDYKD